MTNKVTFEFKYDIVWNCPSNSTINGTIVDTYNMAIYHTYVDFIPRIGEKIIHESKSVVVHDVIHEIDKNNVIVVIKSEPVIIDYYDYMKMFTHCCDHYKLRTDPTFVKNYEEYTFVQPRSLYEWRKDIDIMKNANKLTTEERIKLANRRCRLKTKE